MKRAPSKIYMVLVFAFLYLPILLMIFFSFSDSRSFSEFSGFSLEKYGELFRNDDLMQAVTDTLLIALLSSLIASVLGTMAAIGIHNLKKKWQPLVMNVSNLPIINPEIVTGVSLMLLLVAVLRPAGMSLGFATVLIAHILFNTPYVILNVLPRLRRMDFSLYEAAMDLGCPPQKAFWRAVFPEIFPGILAGALMAFTFSLDDFVISYFTGGNFQTLSVFINGSLKKGVQPWMLSLTGLMFLIVLALLLVMNFSDIRRAKQDEKKTY
ncbi:MAG: ABC transporter permease [Clostridia bacterium]|nr:ABC transporter permease [Clostridia bacterium]